MKAKRNPAGGRPKKPKTNLLTVKGRPSPCSDSSLGLMSAIEGRRAFRCHGMPAFPSSPDSIEPALSRRRHLEGHVARRSLNQNQRKSRSASGRQAEYGQDPPRKRALFNISDPGPLTVGATPYFAYALFDDRCPAGMASSPTTPRSSRLIRARRT
jgi:hypothetical protein